MRCVVLYSGEFQLPGQEEISISITLCTYPGTQISNAEYDFLSINLPIHPNNHPSSRFMRRITQAPLQYLTSSPYDAVMSSSSYSTLPMLLLL